MSASPGAFPLPLCCARQRVDSDPVTAACPTARGLTPSVTLGGSEPEKRYRSFFRQATSDVVSKIVDVISLSGRRAKNFLKSLADFNFVCVVKDPDRGLVVYLKGMSEEQARAEFLKLCAEF